MIFKQARLDRIYKLATSYVRKRSKPIGLLTGEAGKIITNKKMPGTITFKSVLGKR